MAGYESNGTKLIAKVWKNGAATSFDAGSNYLIMNSVFVSGTDVYVAGLEYNNTSTASNAHIFKNGVATPLIKEYTYTGANGIFVITE